MFYFVVYLFTVCFVLCKIGATTPGDHGVKVEISGEVQQGVFSNVGAGENLQSEYYISKCVIIKNLHLVIVSCSMHMMQWTPSI